jgi:hypothetical protein
VVHFHGGLVNRRAGLAIADRLDPVYERAGGHPIFFLWQSGFGETIARSLSAIADERIFKQLLTRVVQFAVGKTREALQGTRGITVDLPNFVEVYDAMSSSVIEEPYKGLSERPEALSESQEQQFLGILVGDPVIQEEAAEIGRSRATNMSPEVLAEFGEATADGRDRALITTARIVKGALTTVKHVLERQRQRRGHGLYATAVEELLREFYLANAGRIVWRQMKQDTVDAFGDDGERFAGTALVEELAARELEETPVLVGHSAGALCICNFLAKADALLPEGRDFDVVLLAPACDFQMMDRTFERHGDRIRRLRIFCMNDQLECRDRLLPGVYPRSLLYFVSGALESQADWPLLGMQRFHVNPEPFADPDFPEIDRVRAALATKTNSTVWSISTGMPGLASKAMRHGDFDDDDATLNSVACFISAS